MKTREYLEKYAGLLFVAPFFVPLMWIISIWVWFWGKLLDTTILNDK